MSVSSTRRPAASALIAAGTAAAAVLGLALPAGASTGTAEISAEQAGYTATGAQFQAITTAVFLRQPGQYADQVAGFGHSVQLWSSGRWSPSASGLARQAGGRLFGPSQQTLNDHSVLVERGQ